MTIGNYGLKHKESIRIYNSKNFNFILETSSKFLSNLRFGEIDSLSFNESQQQIMLTPLEMLEILQKNISFECFKNSFK